MNYKGYSCKICGNDDCIDGRICDNCLDRIRYVFNIDWNDADEEPRVDELAEEATKIAESYSSAPDEPQTMIEAVLDDGGIKDDEKSSLLKLIKEELRSAFFVGVLCGKRNGL